MGDPGHSAFVNRDEPIPVFHIPALDAETSATSKESTRPSKREALKHKTDKIKGKIEDAKEHYKQTKGTSVQERLFNTLMQQVIPAEADEDGNIIKDERSSSYVERPNFSLPMMSANFRRFNARIGPVFVFQNRLIRLFSWRDPTHTLSLLAIYTLVCLQPALIPSVPLAIILFFIMIPSFLTRHPPPPAPSGSVSTTTDGYLYTDSYASRPVAPPQHVKPAPELSKDFFRNMRDLQNSMADFSLLHDSLLASIPPYTDFSDEKLSTAVFLSIFALSCIAFLASHLVPWRFVAVITGWLAICAGHPKAQDMLLSTQNLSQAQSRQQRLASAIRNWFDHDIVLDEPSEIREVEIFELQKQHPTSSRGNVHFSPSESSSSTSAQSTSQPPAPNLFTSEYEPWLFSPSAYDPLSPARLAGARPQGTQFFEEVSAPSGWRWRDKKWSLDLHSGAWVEERCVTGVEVETEGERWVYDLVGGPETGDGQGQGQGQAVAGKGKAKALTAAPKSWSEGTSKGWKGEWRRRRWVRLVERKVIKVSAADREVMRAAEIRELVLR